VGRPEQGELLGEGPDVPVHGDRGAIGFAEKLIALLGEGRFTATYKYAVILGLMDLCLENSSRAGEAPNSVTTRQLAEKTLELYWAHTLPFEGGTVLKQNSGQQAWIVSEIIRFRTQYAPDMSATLVTARIAEPLRFKRLLRKIEWTLVQMPLPKLQRIGRESHEFFYRIAWDDGITKSQFNSPSFDNAIRFIGGNGDHLVRLAGLLRPLVQREWADRVIRLNHEVVGEPELDEFLFGAERRTLEPVRAGLREVQDNLCFFCSTRMTAKVEVDHFIPWSRYPDNGIENLVVAHAKCNNAKRNHLAAADHVAHWVERAGARQAELAEVAAQQSWVRHPARTVSVARSIYLRLPDDALLWDLENRFVPLDRDRVTASFCQEYRDTSRPTQAL
jgi:hypothetical protein